MTKIYCIKFVKIQLKNHCVSVQLLSPLNNNREREADGDSSPVNSHITKRREENTLEETFNTKDKEKQNDRNSLLWKNIIDFICDTHEQIRDSLKNWLRKKTSRWIKWSEVAGEIQKHGGRLQQKMWDSENESNVDAGKRGINQSIKPAGRRLQEGCRRGGGLNTIKIYSGKFSEIQ